MKAQLLITIRNRYVIKRNSIFSYTYLAYCKKHPQTIKSLSFDEFAYKLLINIYGFWKTRLLINKYRKRKKIRTLRKNIYLNGYTKEHIIWLVNNKSLS